jgi:AraC-like DNA-binding protein
MMEALAETILRYTERQAGPGPYEVPSLNLHIMRSDRPNPPSHRIFEPALCIVAQGAKWANFGEERFVYRAGEALVVGVETPSTGRVVEASPDEPCLVLALALDPDIMRSVAEEMDSPPVAGGKDGRGIFVADFDGPLADCARRLVRLLDTPEAVPVLYPGIMREICYWLLTGPHGSKIAHVMSANGPSRRLMDALHNLRDRFAEPVRIEELATVARMSVSAFHRQFKALTSMTPLQYQKQLRLLEARRLMNSRAFNVEAAAFAVGYESPSQFSREYARLFGVPPKRHVKHLHAIAGDQGPEGDERRAL